MPVPSIHTLYADLASSRERVQQSERVFGIQSDEYRVALRKFTQLWMVLRMTRRNEEFLRELTSPSPEISQTAADPQYAAS